MSRYKPVGWRNDNYRHSLAARGFSKRSALAVYTLKLDNGKYYVGWAKNKEKAENRINEHFSGVGSDWTKKYKPEEVIEVKQGGWPIERQTTLDLMRQNGVENVRGSAWSKPNIVVPLQLLQEQGRIPNYGELLEEEEELDKEVSRKLSEHDPVGFADKYSRLRQVRDEADFLKGEFSAAELNMMTLMSQGLPPKEIEKIAEIQNLPKISNTEMARKIGGSINDRP
jgi:hypothetical protein